jgi:hypothetical protein
MTAKRRSAGFFFLVIPSLCLFIAPTVMAVPTANNGNGHLHRNRALLAATTVNGNRHGKHHGGRNTSAVPATAADVFSALGSAGPTHWTVLEVGAGTVSLSNPQGAVYGNVGIGQKGKLQGSGPMIHGDVYMGDSSSGALSGTSTVTGMVHLGKAAIVTPSTLTMVHDSSTQATLDQARSDAIAASAKASSVASTSSLTSLNLGHTTMSLTSGVYNFSSLNLDHSTLTLSGTGYFIFNITSSFVFNSGKVLLADGATESNILFNYTGTSQASFTGGTGGTNPGGPDESVLHGILLALNAKVALSPGLVVGEIISGQDISIVSGGIVQQPPATVPDLASTFDLSVIALGSIAALRALTLRKRVRRARSS